MKIVTSQQMRELDRAAIERHGIPSLDLMERAGQGLAQAALRAKRGPGPIVVLAGRGNNGGDGFAAARHLIKSGQAVLTVVLAAKQDLSADAKTNCDRLT
ncbi:MAG: NAD(P)H-hydrate epimerase, partial [bacterium]